MNILKDIEKGAATQFGKEIGKATANQILKGKNAIIISDKNRYEGRLLPSDSELVRTIKEVKKLEFITSDKGNITRLIEITNKLIPLLDFKGNDSLLELVDIKTLLDVYNTKYEHGEALIETTDGKALDFLKSKQIDLFEAAAKFNADCKVFVTQKQNETSKNLKSKKTAMLLAFFLGIFGVQYFYLSFKKLGGLGILSILLCTTGISSILGIIEGFKLLSMNDDIFNSKYNTEYHFYQQFSF